jgi:hypothetical protein
MPVLFETGGSILMFVRVIVESGECRRSSSAA